MRAGGGTGAHFFSQTLRFLPLSSLSLALDFVGARSPTGATDASESGGLNALNPAITSEIFGLPSFGAIYGTITMSLAVGSCVVFRVPGDPDCLVHICT